MSVSFRHNFRTLSKKFPQFSEVYFFTFYFLCSANFRIQKCDGERNKKNSRFCKTCNCIYSFRENNTEVLVISKSLKVPYDDRTDTNFIVPLRMHLQRSKSTRDSLKDFSKLIQPVHTRIRVFLFTRILLDGALNLSGANHIKLIQAL